ncbi:MULTISPECIES: hypothetical protein [unclassified Fibrobacter]|uniref:hypothetical protein n=1 Tax=unclassified Fibrobacter TaxID=2634177 RepID=UPI000D6DAA30|nr:MULTISPECIES: hypothetical protein [unclassified Fibrobacter]PWJ59731.1 hypothetical protein BGX12_1403 [Fibrobacter sp. UWR4]PZW63569.1 hypothetical protein C8E88_10433 [Fibrobacter sp. UWR1]
MEHEFTIRGRISPSAELGAKQSWIEQDFESIGLKFNSKDTSKFTLKSEDLDNGALEQACMNLSIILNCKVALCKDHEQYGVANVFNGGSDYEVVDEDCYLWIYERGTRLESEHTKFFNEKFISLPL